MQERCVSVVIATHNRAHLLEQALACLADQEHRPLEVVVVDDGSCDDTRQRVSCLSRQWRHDSALALHYRYQRNEGPAVARNRGMHQAQGDCILFMDDDDLMAGDAISQLVRALDGRHDAAISYAGYADTDADGRTDAQLHLPAPIRSPHALLESMIGGSWFVPIHGNLFTRRALERIGPWNRQLSSQEDDEFILRAIMQDVGFVPAPGARVYYRQHVGTRRSQPGKPGEWDEPGQIRRLDDDVTIRRLAHRTLVERGTLLTYRGAFGEWYRRLQSRYGPLLASQGLMTDPLVQWARTAAEEAPGSSSTRRKAARHEPQAAWPDQNALTA